MNLPLHSRFLLFTCEALRFAHTGIYSIFFTIRMKINFQSAVLYYSTKQRTIVHKYFWGLFTARNYQITAILVITFFFSCYDSHLGLILAARNAGTTWLQFCRGAEGKRGTFLSHRLQTQAAACKHYKSWNICLHYKRKKLNFLHWIFVVYM